MRRVSFTYEYPRAALAVDCVVFGVASRRLELLLIERGLEPFKGSWALPGGFVRVDETLDEAAARELVEEAGVRVSYLEQLYSFGAIDRDPRERVISIAYYALVESSAHVPRAETDARRASWFPVDALPTLAFDHAEIVKVALERLRSKVRYRPIGFGLLPERFTLTQLQYVYEAILGRSLDKRNFRKKILSFGFVEATQKKESNVPHRAAELYRFNKAGYERWAASGYDFEV
ncbi:MAG: NUDIX domain-containing protein [Polyangiaceae bacterium]